MRTAICSNGKTGSWVPCSQDARLRIVGRDGRIKDDEAGRPAHDRGEEPGIREPDRERIARAVRVADQRLAPVVHGDAAIDLRARVLEEVEVAMVPAGDEVPGGRDALCRGYAWLLED